jgi:hypothetical protein
MRPSTTTSTLATTLPAAALALLLAPAAVAQPAGFGDYWYQGEAEVTSYELEQARYGEVHPGEAVMIFVTEDFSRSKQVKLDDPGAAGDDAVKVLKLNAIRKFYTGVYPYSMMTSVFTPVAPTGSLPRTLKVTTSSQEWCGHTFTQKNRTGDGWRVALFSYFESEGDRTVELPGAIPEDELWTLVRLAPEELPTGEVSLIPGTVFQRLRHLSWEVHRATARLEPAEEEGLMVYTVDYRDLDRELTILFRRDFPHEIEGFEERTPSGFGRGAETLTTRARKKARILLDYWRHNGVDDGHYREQLGLK